MSCVDGGDGIGVQAMVAWRDALSRWFEERERDGVERGDGTKMKMEVEEWSRVSGFRES